MVQHENELMNHRIGWMATCNGLLFAALGFVWDKPRGNAVAYVIAIPGIFTCASARSSLYVARKALVRLQCLWDKKGTDEADVPPVIGWHDERHWLQWLLPWYSLPVIFAAAWASILAITALR